MMPLLEALKALCMELGQEDGLRRRGRQAPDHLHRSPVPKSEESAETIAKSVISSTLTKAAIFGADANWGRVLCAMGYSGEAFDPDKVDVSLCQCGRRDRGVCRRAVGWTLTRSWPKRS